MEYITATYRVFRTIDLNCWLLWKELFNRTPFIHRLQTIDVFLIELDRLDTSSIDHFIRSRDRKHIGHSRFDFSEVLYIRWYPRYTQRQSHVCWMHREYVSTRFACLRWKGFHRNGKIMSVHQWIFWRQRLRGDSDWLWSIAQHSKVVHRSSVTTVHSRRLDCFTAKEFSDALF